MKKINLIMIGFVALVGGNADAKKQLKRSDWNGVLIRRFK